MGTCSRSVSIKNPNLGASKAELLNYLITFLESDMRQSNLPILYSFIQVDPRFREMRDEEEFQQILARNEKIYADIRAELDEIRKTGKL